MTAQTIDVAEVIDRNPISAFQWRVVALCGLIAILDGFDTQAIGFVAPVIASEFGVDRSDMGGVFAAGLAGLMLGAFVFSPLADRWGRKPVILLSCLLFGGFALLTITANDLNTLTLFRFLTGLGLGGAMPNINILTMEYAPTRRRAMLMTLMFVGFPLGAICGGVLSAGLIAEFGWRSIFIIGGVAPLILLLLLVPALPESVRFQAAQETRRSVPARRNRLIASLKRIDRDLNPSEQSQFTIPHAEASKSIIALFTEGRGLGTLLIWGIFFLNLLIMYALVNWLPTVMFEAGLPLERAIIATAVLNVGGVAGGLTIAMFMDRIGPWWSLGIAYIGAAVFITLVGNVSAGLFVTLAIVFVAGYCNVGAQFGMNALVSSYYPTSVRSTGLGWALAVGRLGSIAGPLMVGGLLASQVSQNLLFAYGGCAALLAAVLLLLLSRLRGSEVSNT